MSYCGENCLSRHDLGAVVAVSLRCRAWTCPDCADGRKKQLIAQCHRGSPSTFLTLTLRRVPGQQPNIAALTMTRAWRLLRLRIMRRYKLKRLPFAAIMEATKAGWPHLHILLRSVWLDQKWLSEQMSDIADSPIVWIERIDHRARVNAYVAKYCGKAAHKFGTAKRYFFSHDYDLLPKEERDKFKKSLYRWDRQELSLTRYAEALRTLGFDVTFDSQRQFRAARPP
jgi:hypothetical protein